MKKISTIECNNFTYHLTEEVSMYLYSWLNNYLMKNKVKGSGKGLFIADDNLNKLIEEVRSSLQILLKSGYEEPALGEIQKYSTRYEKILLDNIVYKVNYRMSSFGHSAYLINCILNDLIVSASDKLSVKLY
ncbi:hypothetical protein [Sphingobacterium ginsenosidimutans]|uniref:Uncharacterized protein n=2 Tax=Sphingobacterium TaxID=28453 RepID=A0ABP8AMU1_9SPHI